MLNAVLRRLDHLALLLQRMDSMVGLVGVRIILLKLIEQPAALAKEFRFVDGAARRNGEGQQDTGYGRVHPRVEHRGPHAPPRSMHRSRDCEYPANWRQKKQPHLQKRGPARSAKYAGCKR